jgi:CheY-like chemotaxis protein
MSHELRTPLNAIVGMVDVLALTPLNAEQRECVEILRRNALALLAIIGDQTSESVLLNLGEVLAALPHPGLTCAIAPDVPQRLIGNPARLRELAMELLNASPGPQHMTVTTETSLPGRLRFTAGSNSFTADFRVPNVPAGLRILVVDDSEDNRALILSYLRRTDSHADTAENGLIALDLFRKNRYDIVLTDVEMPLMDGYQTVQAIRQFECQTGAPSTPVIALTAHSYSETAAKGYAAGFTDLLTKPIRHVTLLDALAKHAAAAIPVHVPDDIADVAPAYLEKRKAEAAVYHAALIASDFATIRDLAHKMKGTGAGYGFPVLTELGASLETAALNADTPVLTEKIREFALYVERIRLR